MTLLSTQAKQIQRLHREANQSYRQIAASVGCSPATAYRYASDPKRATSERAKPIRASKLQSVDRDAFLQRKLPITSQEAEKNQEISKKDGLAAVLFGSGLDGLAEAGQRQSALISAWAYSHGSHSKKLK